MTNNELLAYIRDELKKAALTRQTDAVNTYLVIKHAEQLSTMDVVDVVSAIGRRDSYATEFRKAIKVAKVIKQRGL